MAALPGGSLEGPVAGMPASCTAADSWSIPHQLLSLPVLPSLMYFQEVLLSWSLLKHHQITLLTLVPLSLNIPRGTGQDDTADILESPTEALVTVVSTPLFPWDLVFSLIKGSRGEYQGGSTLSVSG